MKRILIVIITLLLAVSLTGCSADSLGDYKKAAEKTEQIKKGQTSGEFSLAMDFNTEGMTAEEIKELNYYKDMKGNFSTTYDDEREMAIFRNYLNFGGLGFDFDLFMNGDEVFMKLPVVGKYMRLDGMQTATDIKNADANGDADGRMSLISQETKDGFSAMWLGLINKEDVFKGKNIVLTTPDGEVKTTEYTIRLNDEQVKSLAEDGIEMLLKDKKLKEGFDQYIKKNVESLEDNSFEKMLSDMNEGINNCTIESFNYTAYVDIDGYIVNEMFDLRLKVENPEHAGPTNISYKLDIKNWDINKDQKFDFPVLTEENTLDMDEMDENMPFMMEDLLKNKN